MILKRCGMMIWCLTLLCLVPGWANPDSNQREEPKIDWQGFISCKVSLSGMEEGLPSEVPGWALMTNQAEYERFVARIPKDRLQKRQPAPPSEDPLLQLPPVNFEEFFLIAAWSNNVHIDCQIERTDRVGEDLQVEVRYHTPKDYRNYAAPYGYGQYHCLRVPKFPGKVLYQSHEQLED